MSEGVRPCFLHMNIELQDLPLMIAIIDILETENNLGNNTKKKDKE